MKIDMSMTRDENKFTSERWWASSPSFVLWTLQSQLEAAAAIWPELKEWKLIGPPEDPPKTTDAPAAVVQQNTQEKN